MSQKEMAVGKTTITTEKVMMRYHLHVKGTPTWVGGLLEKSIVIKNMEWWLKYYDSIVLTEETVHEILN